MLRWIRSFLVDDWTEAACGCRFRHHTFRPMESKRCPKHEREIQEMMRSYRQRCQDVPTILMVDLGAFSDTAIASAD